MLQAITTKYLGPTNSRGGRIKATCAAGSLTVGYKYALNTDANHAAAAKALVEKLGWTPDQGKGYAGTWVGGGLPDGRGNCYVFTGEGSSGNGWPLGTAFEIE